MIKRLLYRPETILFVLLLLITYQFKWKKDEWRFYVLSSDGRGYYAYLTAAIIYQDFTYESSTNAINEQLDADLTHHCILKTPEGKTYNKTFPGVAIVMTPMFFIAYFLSFLFGFELNGYSDLFLIGVQLSAILSAVIGFYFLKKLLIARRINSTLAVYTSFFCVLGSNIYFNATDFPSLSHIYSFFAISLFLYLTHIAIHNSSTKHTYLGTAILCLIFLIRPTNIIILLLIPFIAGSKKKLLDWLHLIFGNYKTLTTTLLIGIGVLSTLPILWFVQTGHFILWSYDGEGFYWTNPLPHKVLFSFRNGAFIYSPLALIGLFGLIPLWFKDKFSTSFGIIYFLLNLYIISSWWTFYYGGGFGHRAMSDHFIFSFILLADLISWKPKFGKIQTSIFAIPFVLLSLLQGYQMNKGILPYAYINWEMYSTLFLKTADKYKGECDGTHDCPPYGKLVYTDYKRADNYYQEETIDFPPSKPYGGDLNYIPLEKYKDTHLFLEVLYTKKRLNNHPFNDVFFVIDGQNENDQTVFYKAFPLYDIRSEALNEFKTVSLELQLNDKKVKKYKFYIWNKGQKSFVIKDLDYRFHYYQP